LFQLVNKSKEGRSSREEGEVGREETENTTRTRQILIFIFYISISFLDFAWHFFARNDVLSHLEVVLRGSNW
jgi:hypothetical protein